MVSFRKAALLLLAVDQAAGFSSPRALLSLYVGASHVVSSSSLRMSTAANGSVNGVAAAAIVPTAAPTAITSLTPTDITLVNTPAQAFQAMATKGESNAKMSVAKTVVAAIMGGFYAGVGGMTSLSVSGNMPGVAATNPGLIKFTFAALFPVALFLCLQGAAQLFTGNTASMAAAYCEGKVTKKDVLRNWVLSYFGNFLGCGIFLAAMSYTGILTGGVAKMAASMTVTKVLSASFMQTVVKGMLCNWLVCTSIFLAAQAKDIPGKYISMFLPVTAFVCIGFEHSVANMFILPAGIVAGAAGVSWKTMLLRNLLPVTIGNTLAGALMVGALMSWQFGTLGEGK